MVAPIVNFGKLLGTINVYDVSAHAFSSDDLRTLGFVAGRAAVAIENASAFEQVRDSAIRDPLTNLHNGGYLISFLQRELRRSERLGGRASVIGIDLDNFKAINDSMGHQEGDRVLREVASIFCGQLREYDQAFRNGGDEFVVVLPDTPSSEAVRVAARIQSEVDSYAAGMADTVGVKLGASVGVATYPKDADNPEELLAKADANMYENKRARKQGKLAA
ncbi:sensor domain-containing diguanylate cyclase [bacterium]|nr:sensor domain-containing diguanylate cyclase [bacterium]